MPSDHAARGSSAGDISITRPRRRNERAQLDLARGHAAAPATGAARRERAGAGGGARGARPSCSGARPRGGGARARAAGRRRRAARCSAARAPCGRRRRPASSASGSALGTIWTTGATRVRTSRLPSRSTMSPRGASILILRTRFSRAWVDVVLARQHLQEPEAEEDDREQHEGEAAEHGDAHRELRRDRRDGALRGWAAASGARERAEPAGRVGPAPAAARVVGQERRAASGARSA